jgi:hypothetical protein
MKENHKKKTIPNEGIRSVSPILPWLGNQNEEITWTIVTMVIEDYMPLRMVESQKNVFFYCPIFYKTKFFIIFTIILIVLF